MTNLAGAAMLLPVIVQLRGHGTSSGGIGLALAGEAVGALAGALLVGRLHRLAGPGALLLAVAWLCVPVTLAPLLPGGAVTVFAALFVVGLGTPTLRVMIDLLVFRQVPDELRGRVVAATMTLLTVGMPAGMLGSGLLLDHFSPTTALATVAALLAAALLPATAGRTLRRSAWPATVRPRRAGHVARPDRRATPHPIGARGRSPPRRPSQSSPRKPNLRHAPLTLAHPCGCTPHATHWATG